MESDDRYRDRDALLVELLRRHVQVALDERGELDELLGGRHCWCPARAGALYAI